MIIKIVKKSGRKGWTMSTQVISCSVLYRYTSLS